MLFRCAPEPDALVEDLEEREQTADGLLDAPGGAREVVELAAEEAPRVCPMEGHVTYTLQRVLSPTATQRSAYTKIRAAMDKAVSYYNCYTDISKTLTVQYVPSVATADGNISGNIRFGAESTFEYSRALHEIAHTVGVGTAPRWQSLIRDGVFVGTRATAQLRALTGKQDDVVHADRQHFWPYGLNYASELKSEADVIGHCRMVVALRSDLGVK
jgi:hypothetical protein